MQDRYVGDVGDFAKYALLRALAKEGTSRLRLGVNWYMYPDEAHNNDGRHVSYLRDEAFAALDPRLHAALRGIVEAGRRSVDAVRTSGVLPRGTLHYGEPVPVRRAGTVLDVGARYGWAARGLEALSAADLVFLDPDNGIEVTSVGPRSAKAGKYVLWEEVGAHWAAGQSLLVYHHLNRTMSVAAQVEGLSAAFGARLGKDAYVSPMVFRRGSCRAFCVVGQPAHADALRSRERAFLAAGWARHFLSAVPA